MPTVKTCKHAIEGGEVLILLELLRKSYLSRTMKIDQAVNMRMPMRGTDRCRSQGVVREQQDVPVAYVAVVDAQVGEIVIDLMQVDSGNSMSLIS
jgi:hypothetical protein